MGFPTDYEYDAYFSRIIDATKAGRMEWNQVNPTTYYWKRLIDGVSVSVSIQQTLSGLTGLQHYVFTIDEEGDKTVIKSDERYGAWLRNLYEVIGVAKSRSTLNVLKKIADSL